MKGVTVAAKTTAQEPPVYLDAVLYRKVKVPCRDCKGRGHDTFNYCTTCAGYGWRPGYEPAR